MLIHIQTSAITKIQPWKILQQSDSLRKGRVVDAPVKSLVGSPQFAVQILSQGQKIQVINFIVVYENGQFQGSTMERAGIVNADVQTFPAREGVNRLVQGHPASFDFSKKGAVELAGQQVRGRCLQSPAPPRLSEGIRFPTVIFFNDPLDRNACVNDHRRAYHSKYSSLCSPRRRLNSHSR